MQARPFKVDNCPDEALTFVNKAIVSPNDFPPNVKHVGIATAQQPQNWYIFTILADKRVKSGTIAFNKLHRAWASLAKDAPVQVSPFEFNPNKQYISKIAFDVDFVNAKAAGSASTTPIDADHMAREITQQFYNMAFTRGQQFAFRLTPERPTLVCTVRDILSLPTDLLKGEGDAAAEPQKISTGMLLPNSSVTLKRAEGSSVNLTGKAAQISTQQQALFNPNWDLQNLGIGGLDKEFNAIFRRAFASRVFPVEIIEQLGIKHVRGILLYGPPGTGKTLMARQIGKMLNAREPKIVNGPDILDKYVGESEANIRRLFEDAENEFKRLGNNSGLHIIIFDEIDAICKQRGSVAGASGVHDTVVNQLLSKMDGVEALNNILVIGMTNRRDMIDEALMRPGRLEVQLEISLPDEHGRLQILNIHTANLKTYGKLSSDVDLSEIARLTKNFSGAEIEGLVRSAESTAMNRLVSGKSKVMVDPNAVKNLCVCRGDFLHALEFDVKPLFGSSQEEVESMILNGIITWGTPVQQQLNEGLVLIQQARDAHSTGLVTVLIEGAPKTGKTALAARLAIASEFPFIKLCSPDAMVGYTETAKCQMIRKVFDDAYKSTFSCIIVDNIERLLDYAAIGNRYSNLVLQALLVLLNKQPPKGRRLLVLCTTSRKDILDQLELTSAFSDIIHCSNLNRPEHLLAVLNSASNDDDPKSFKLAQRNELANRLHGIDVSIGIKKLLNYIDMARQFDPNERVNKFLCKLEEDGCIGMMRNLGIQQHQ